MSETVGSPRGAGGMDQLPDEFFLPLRLSLLPGPRAQRALSFTFCVSRPGEFSQSRPSNIISVRHVRKPRWVCCRDYHGQLTDPRSQTHKNRVLFRLRQQKKGEQRCQFPAFLVPQAEAETSDNCHREGDTLLPAFAAWGSLLCLCAPEHPQSPLEHLSSCWAAFLL